ncbi:hypothetical protein HDU76_000496 [Blyttiomyces sp. JEL0837]|nr:hypothetical protein HDU76_000496 [Blyttiomyces sp. JEL0837]
MAENEDRRDVKKENRRNPLAVATDWAANWYRKASAPEKKPYNPSILDCFELGCFEPYWIGLKSVVPPFDERFRGYSFNKRSHSIELQIRGFRFYVAPNVYVIHRPHGDSESKVRWLAEDLLEIDKLEAGETGALAGAGKKGDSSGEVTRPGEGKEVGHSIVKATVNRAYEAYLDDVAKPYAQLRHDYKAKKGWRNQNNIVA